MSALHARRQIGRTLDESKLSRAVTQPGRPFVALAPRSETLQATYTWEHTDSVPCRQPFQNYIYRSAWTHWNITPISAPSFQRRNFSSSATRTMPLTSIAFPYPGQALSPATEDTTPDRSGIHGTTDITVKILSLKDAAKVIEEALATRDLTHRIRAIEIDITADLEAEAEAEEQENTDQHDANVTNQVSDANAESDNEDAASAKSAGSNDSASPPTRDAALFDKNYVDERMNRYCAPIIQLLNAIESSGGSLESFSWDSKCGWWDSNGTRPREFWDALWQHARTLQKLTLGFYTHEVHKVRPAQVHFPAMRELRINADTAHGDEGDAVEHLLKTSAALEVLVFHYPGCDLDTCQIKNVTWDYNFPNLKFLEVNGYDFAPDAFKEFLGRCGNVEIFEDLIDHDYDGEERVAVLKTTLPKLRKLYKDYGTTNDWNEWFDADAARPIEHLTVRGGPSSQLANIATGVAVRGLKTLEFEGYCTDWRAQEREPPASDDSSEEVETEEQKMGMTLRAQGIKNLLPKLLGLQELGIGLGSDNISISLPGGGWGSPSPMDEKDLRTVLSILPTDTQIRALRLWDEAAGKLSQTILDDFPAVPESLQYLSWEGKEKKLYKVERLDGQVKLQVCDGFGARKVPAEWHNRSLLGV
ncbi:hypothetical protein K491DRAFT_782272 [Lophiostoma macrostomum CBS 122681]|uniref:Uncharacterized protein n=1 Tax=Lophiostoma macrostomum CBS 122681 TaxID=1314788 RepID=A0A6A6SUZ4_9PLEO|nr:hypothetical protein K491DRAFT_782272 [Lophiostoma macrostomum CBS 122681]